MSDENCACQVRGGPNDSISIRSNSLFSMQPLLSHGAKEGGGGFPVDSNTALRINFVLKTRKRLTEQNKIEWTGKSACQGWVTILEEASKQTNFHRNAMGGAVISTWENSSGILMHARLSSHLG